MKLTQPLCALALTHFVVGFQAIPRASHNRRGIASSSPLAVAPISDLSAFDLMIPSVQDVTDQAASLVASWILYAFDAVHHEPASDGDPLQGCYLPTETLVETLHYDIHTRNSLVTADFTRSIYENTCRFKDGSGLDGAYPMMPWVLGCKMLFKAEKSKARIVQETLVVSVDKITFRFESDLEFRGPFSPRVLLTGRIVMARNPDTGRISSYKEIWDKEVLEVVKDAKLQFPSFLKSLQSIRGSSVAAVVASSSETTPKQDPSSKRTMTAMAMLPYKSAAKAIQTSSKRAAGAISPNIQSKEQEMEECLLDGCLV